MKWNKKLSKEWFSKLKYDRKNHKSKDYNKILHKKEAIYIWNLERWYSWTYLQGTRRRSQRLMDTEGNGEGWKNWESSTETYALPYVKLLGWCKSNSGFALLNFTTWYSNTWLCLKKAKKNFKCKYWYIMNT